MNSGLKFSNGLEHMKSDLEILTSASLTKRDFPTLALLVGMLPLDQINLNNIAQLGPSGFDLILNTERLKEHSEYPKFVRNLFCLACTELNIEEMKRFAPHATESNHVEGFLFVLLPDMQRHRKTLSPTPTQGSSLVELINQQSQDFSVEQCELIDALIPFVSNTVLRTVSQSIRQYTVYQNRNTTTHPFGGGRGKNAHVLMHFENATQNKLLHEEVANDDKQSLKTPRKM